MTNAEHEQLVRLTDRATSYRNQIERLQKDREALRTHFAFRVERGTKPRIYSQLAQANGDLITIGPDELQAILAKEIFIAIDAVFERYERAIRREFENLVIDFTSKPSKIETAKPEKQIAKSEASEKE